MARLLTVLAGLGAGIVLSGCYGDFGPVKPYAKVSLLDPAQLAHLPHSTPIPTHDEKIQALRAKVEAVWREKDVPMATPERLVKYTRNYRDRAEVDFVNGYLRITSLDGPEFLKKAIVSALLTPDNPRQVDLYSDDAWPTQGRPFLYGQVVDQFSRPIDGRWKADRFAEFLIGHKLLSRDVRGQTRWYVEIPMTQDALDQRARRYLPWIEKYAKLHGVRENLILAVMETESHFNPFAISRAPAIGLMQIVAKRAGRDAYQAIYGRMMTPSRSYLFEPKSNIQMGVVYLSLLQERYLGQIRHPLSREYAMIAAYNGGPTALLSLFSRDPKVAVTRINQMSPEAFYLHIKNAHPRPETRDYLVKVTNAQKKYANQGMI
jgi:membrane-bound lytic murein transglycosylase C